MHCFQPSKPYQAWFAQKLQDQHCLSPFESFAILRFAHVQGKQPISPILTVYFIHMKKTQRQGSVWLN